MSEGSKQIVSGRERARARAWMKWGVPTALGAAAFLIRMIAIGQESFWTDEILSRSSLREGVWRWIWNTECHPPLFFLLLKGWSLLFGQGHVALRSFSALAGAAAVPMLWICARRWGLGAWASTAAALILLIHPFATLHSQQNRYYALLMLFGIAWLATIPALYQDRGRRIRWGFLLAGFAAFLTHYYFAFLALGGGIGALLGWTLSRRDRCVLRRMLLNFSILAVLMATLLPLMIHQRRFIPAQYLAPPGWPDLARVFTNVFWVGPWNETAAWMRWPIALMAMTALAGNFRESLRWFTDPQERNLPVGTGKELRKEPQSRRKGPQRKARALDILFLTNREIQERAYGCPPGMLFFFTGVFPIMACFCFSRWVSPMFIADRYTSLFLPAFILWLVLGWKSLITERNAPWLTGIMVMGCVIIAIPSHLKYWTHYQEYDWRGSIRAVEAQWRPGDAMVFCPDWLSASYLDNGGTLKNMIGAQDGKGMAQARRFWLFVWEQAPAESGRAALQNIREQHGNPFVIHFPHITLSLIERARGVK